MTEKPPALKTDIFYSLITLGNTALWAILSGWLLYFYLPPAGEGQPLVPATAYGVIVFLIRALNALLAPAIGHLSDNAQSRWGRRLPFIFFSTPPMLLFFVLLWTPPQPGISHWNLLYMALIFLLYNLAYSFNQIPYTALLPEIARTEEHRVRISAWSSGFLLLGMILGSLASPLIEQLGYAQTALLYALAALPLFYLPFLVLRERPESRIAATDRLDFRQGLGLMLRNRSFLIMTATGVFYWGTTTLVQGSIPFIVTEICQLPKSATLYFYLPAVLGALASYPLITWLAKQVGKRRVFSVSLLASALVLPGLMVINERWPLPLLAQGIGWITLQAVAMSGVIMLPPAFGAEIADRDAELTGQRREGTYYAAWGLLDQIVNGAAAALLPLVFLLGRSRTAPHGPLGVRLIGVLGGGLMLIAFVIFQQYPQTPEEL
ncbi:MAG TPA: MFS transporter [Thermoflexia bacterium]|nr:MFS transporter [Thermoflexia bacterium]